MYVMRNILYGFLVVILFFSCTSKEYEIKDNNHASKWINFVKVPSSPGKIFQGDEISFVAIPAHQKGYYTELLADTQYIEIEENEYEYFMSKKKERKYALAIRAVYTQGGGYFHVLKNDKNEYYVHYTVMGSRVWEYNKEILVIQADELPTEIFHDYSVVK